MLGWLARRRKAALALGLLAFAAAPAAAQPAGLHPDRYAAIVVEARTGQTLFAANPDEARHPASLTKMMTLYLLFEALRDDRLELSSPIRFSAEAASRPPSKLGVPAGGAISAETAILALVTRSANDVAAAVAERLAGSEENFARQMTMRARQLGMTRTTFRNASGLPDWEQVTTARDMALLGRRLISDFPQHYRYFNTTHFAHGRQIIRNHNGMLLDYDGADGIKTGFINSSGFNIVTSAARDNVRLVGAVFGGTAWVYRNRHMAELLDDGFERMGVRARPTLVAAAPRVVSAREAEFEPRAMGSAPATLAAERPSRAAARAPLALAGVRGVAPTQPRGTAAAPARGGPASASARQGRSLGQIRVAAGAPARSERAGLPRAPAAGARGARQPEPRATVTSPAARRDAGLPVIRVSQPAKAAPAPLAAPPRPAQPARAGATRQADASPRGGRG